jgi:ComF family protein
LHPGKLRKRGFNQSLCFAEGLSKVWNIPVEKDCLFRKKDSGTQTRRSRYERWENVEDIFGIKNQERIKGKHILLVDDVITTGATIEACAAVLLKLETTKVSVLSIAFAAE